NPLCTIDVEWGCCMAAGFNLQPQLAGGEAAAGLGA
ncbi:hypothetical protein SapgrDRAFT_2835, partial [Saprospira grandis DSM 2844]